MPSDVFITLPRRAHAVAIFEQASSMSTGGPSDPDGGSLVGEHPQHSLHDAHATKMTTATMHATHDGRTLATLRIVCHCSLLTINVARVTEDPLATEVFRLAPALQGCSSRSWRRQSSARQLHHETSPALRLVASLDGWLQAPNRIHLMFGDAHCNKQRCITPNRNKTCGAAWMLASWRHAKHFVLWWLMTTICCPSSR